MKRIVAAIAVVLLLPALVAAQELGEPLPGTEKLLLEGDIAAQLVDGVDRFLLRKFDESVEKREQHWKRDFSSREAYEKSIEPNRQRLAHILGVRDERVKFDAPELIATVDRPALLAENDKVKVYAVRWPVVRDMWSEGLLLVPTGDIKANMIAVPDADQTPEQMAGLADDLPGQSHMALRLAHNGYRVLIPTLISRQMEARHGRAKLTNREFVYRSAFELGRHLIGYEVQKILAGVDWFASDDQGAKMKIGVLGYGEGGMLALYAAALDTRIDAAAIGGYFGSRQRIWEQPIDRNVFGLLKQFGDAELATMVFPRILLIDTAAGPELELPGEGGAPARLASPSSEEVEAEVVRALQLVGGLRGAEITVKDLSRDDELANAPIAPLKVHTRPTPEEIEARQQRLIHQMDVHNQHLLRESPYVRKEFMKNLDTSSIEAYEKSVEPYREKFAKEVIGQFDDELLDPKPRTRKTYDEEKWTGYEVVLEVFPDVIAYGILCVPKDLDLAGGERRPVVVCQHGLEGRPQDVIGEKGSEYYSAFASKLAERGFVTFAPQNLYIGQDRFRTLQRKANPLGKTLFSVIVPQHQQIVNWLSDLPFVDGERIAFYGLSYGGKSAMRIPPLVPQYSLSICSADFNEWVDKNASTRAPYSYVWTGEYEIFEFDLGSTFNYAEMAALIAPRPFMVERGHFDGVGTDEQVGYEYAKVQHLYNAQLKIPERCAIEWFVGPHKINGVGTFEFLHKHLKFPER
jgi:dienelactone hydrolase